MLTCPHCLHTFEPSASAPRCCSTPANLLPPTSPCVRVFADSGGGLVLTTTPADKPMLTLPQPTSLTLSFSQPSPSVQLSFVLPPAWMPPPPRPTPHDRDLIRLSSTQRALRSSGWYYEGLSWQESAATLDKCAPGTFLVRDSSDPRFLFSLSVQTARGPTSVRLHYLNGEFRLDAEEHLAHYIPVFECVLRLVEYYVSLGRLRHQAGGAAKLRDRHVWVDVRGHMYSPILLTRPKRRTVPALQHLARVAINQRLQRPTPDHDPVPALNLPPAVQAYLREYPYTC